MVFVLPNESIIDNSANSNGYTVSGEYDVSLFMLNVTAERILIPLSKTKIVLLLVGSVVFVAVSLWLWDHADEIPHRNPLYVEAVAIAGIGFFGLCGLYALFKLFDTAPGLIVDAEVVTGAEAKHRQPNPPLQPPHLFNRGQGMPGV